MSLVTKPGTCDWCKQPVTLVLRTYPAECGGGEFWSVERCSCIERLKAGVGATALTEMGRRREASV